ncbi:hypothetical protein [Methanobrevibacter boviskoreani]|uniref:hypothetical protein n=1 Tax=Methanobrevibacter boviskoreani TaxID=1348249 RepID=UPI0023F3A9B0|nr:hypothetical protein [Methanobrevibacter boviskoreani]MDD6257258.1 hypothetical protein [Methanobrevibacter boviskoreani]
MIQYEINNKHDFKNVSEISEEIITGIVECFDSGETYNFKASRKSKSSDFGICWNISQVPEHIIIILESIIECLSFEERLPLKYAKGRVITCDFSPDCIVSVVNHYINI